MINSVVIAGNLTRDAECKRTQSGMPVVSFGIAVNERRKNGQTGQREDYANYFDVTAFGDRWEKLAQYMPKGSKVTVQGKLRYSTWQDRQTGQNRSKVTVIAEEIELPPKPQGNQGNQQGNQGGGVYQASTSTAGPPIDIDPYASDDIPF